MNTTHTQPKIFKNLFLERLTKTNLPLTVTFYILLIFLFLFLSYNYTSLSILETIAHYVAGLFMWTFMEYVLHRYVFHIDKYFPKMKRFHYIVHGVHHDDPRDRERLFMPPVPGTIIAFLLFLFWYLVFDLNALAFMAGLSNGYLFYSYIHYTIHTNPLNRIFHKHWSHHAKHHYKHPDKAYGVSSPLWDMVFGTMPPRKLNK